MTTGRRRSQSSRRSKSGSRFLRSEQAHTYYEARKQRLAFGGLHPVVPRKGGSAGSASISDATNPFASAAARRAGRRLAKAAGVSIKGDGFAVAPRSRIGAKKRRPHKPGTPGSTRRTGRTLSAATRDKISKALKGRRHTPMSAATKAKISRALLGRKHKPNSKPRKPMSAVTKAKISRALKGKKHGPMSAATKAKISRAQKGRKHARGRHVSAATRAKISAGLKRSNALHPHRKRRKYTHRRGYHLSQATRSKISASLKGKRHHHKGHSMSAATRARISRSLKAYYASHPNAARGRRRRRPAKNSGDAAFHADLVRFGIRRN